MYGNMPIESLSALFHVDQVCLYMSKIAILVTAGSGLLGCSQESRPAYCIARYPFLLRQAGDADKVYTTMKRHHVLPQCSSHKDIPHSASYLTRSWDVLALKLARSRTTNPASFTHLMLKLLLSCSAPMHRGRGSYYWPVKGPIFGLLCYGTRHPFRAALGPKAVPYLATPCASREQPTAHVSRSIPRRITASLTRSQARGLDTERTARTLQQQQDWDSLELVRRQEGQQARW